MFSPEEFMNQTVNGEMSTFVPPTPAGDYIATISKLVLRDATKDGSVPCDVLFDIDDADLKARLKRTRIGSKMTAWLDFKEDGKSLDNGEGKNTGLGKLRAATGQNDPTKPWAPSMLVGQPVRVKVINESDKNGDIRDKVTQVTKL